MTCGLTALGTDWSLTFTRAGESPGSDVWVDGSSESLEAFRETIELAGMGYGSGLHTRDLTDGILRLKVSAETVALFFEFEVLNYM